jgi:hypothetical protein
LSASLRSLSTQKPLLYRWIWRPAHDDGCNILSQTDIIVHSSHHVFHWAAKSLKLLAEANSCFSQFSHLIVHWLPRPHKPALSAGKQKPLPLSKWLASAIQNFVKSSISIHVAFPQSFMFKPFAMHAVFSTDCSGMATPFSYNMITLTCFRVQCFLPTYS